MHGPTVAASLPCSHAPRPVARVAIAPSVISTTRVSDRPLERFQTLAIAVPRRFGLEVRATGLAAGRGTREPGAARRSRDVRLIDLPRCHPNRHHPVGDIRGRRRKPARRVVGGAAEGVEVPSRAPFAAPPGGHDEAVLGPLERNAVPCTERWSSSRGRPKGGARHRKLLALQCTR